MDISIRGADDESVAFTLLDDDGNYHASTREVGSGIARNVGLEGGISRVELPDPHREGEPELQADNGDEQIGRLIASLDRFRAAQRMLDEATEAELEVGGSDMRALQLLVLAHEDDAVITPGAISAHLGITSAATTRLLDRLESAGHIIRSPHPTDRRALAILITEQTRVAAKLALERSRLSWHEAAANVSREQRESAILFLDQLSLRLRKIEK